MGDDTPSPVNNVITIESDQEPPRPRVRGSVETLNALLDAEADRLCNAQRYERSEARRDARAGHYERKLQTKAGEVRLKVPKLRQQTFETAIIERYRRRESSVEEALIEMYLAGVSVRRVEDLTEALWGTRVSPSTVSELNRKIYGTIEEWRNRAIEGEHEDKAGWSAFLKHLKERGLTGRAADHLRCLYRACRKRCGVLAGWQRCIVHWYRNIFSHVPSTKCGKSRPSSRRSTLARTLWRRAKRPSE